LITARISSDDDMRSGNNVFNKTIYVVPKPSMLLIIALLVFLGEVIMRRAKGIKRVLLKLRRGARGANGDIVVTCLTINKILTADERRYSGNISQFIYFHTRLI